MPDEKSAVELQRFEVYPELNGVRLPGYFKRIIHCERCGLEIGVYGLYDERHGDDVKFCDVNVKSCKPKPLDIMVEEPICFVLYYCPNCGEFRARSGRVREIERREVQLERSKYD